VERQVPIFGICFGHQLLAHALGGQVGDSPHGREFGTVEVQLTEEAQGDALFGGLPPAFGAQVAHSQSVLEMPEGARRLASSALEPNQAFAVGDSAWGVQFHPEFDAGVVVVYINRFRETLLAGGTDPDDLLARCVRTPHSARLLRRFAQIASGEA
jgi:GMP synthase (glutamine-hydrolysing)